jgi:putative FmdB family regulatory protein
MPTYVYRREDGSTFEIEQRITADALATCPDTGQKVERVISGSAGLIFKGSGFYLTDYVRKGGNGTSSKEDGNAGNSEGSEAKPSSDASDSKKASPESTSGASSSKE